MPHTYKDPAFHRLLRNVILAPVALMAATAAVLVWQVHRLVTDARAVSGSDQAISRAFELQKVTVDMETGLRGYLLTGQPLFLQPLDEALADRGGRPAVEADSAELAARVAGDPAATADVAELAGRRAAWLRYAADQRARRAAGGDHVAATAEGKRQMDAMRAVFGRLIRAQTAVRETRSAAAERAANLTLVGVAVVVLAGGGLLAGLARQMFLDVTRRFDLAIGTALKLNAELERRVADRTREVEQRSAELERRSAELAEANRELEAFSYSVSHDLRAPMRHIAGFADLLQLSLATRLSDDDAENLRTIQQTARLAGRMVDDLLQFSRIGRSALKAEPVDLAAAVADCRRAVDPDAKGRPIDWSIPPTLPAVTGDPAMVRMVVQNLLSNAVKYTAGRDPATIAVAATAENGTVALTVADNGVGFDMAYAHKLFGVFQRLHRAEEFEGTGIGLANVRRLVTRMGGTVSAAAEVDRGATFTVTLPAA